MLNNKKSSEAKKTSEEYYVEILANTLLSAEVSVLWIGIPLLPSNSTRRKFRSEFFSPIEDYIRCSLVSIPTPELIILADSLVPTNNQAHHHNILQNKLALNLTDKLFFPTLSTMIVFTLVILSISPLSSSLGYAFNAALGASLGACLASSTMVLEPIRYISFNTLLKNELKRRQGKFGTCEPIPI